MIRIVLILFFAWITTVQAEIVKIEKRGIADDIIKCEWENQEGVPCVTIRKTIPNSNAISDKISPTTIITKKQIEENNLIDLPKVLRFVNGINITQSGSTGQQTSVFMRGTNSNHTLVLLNGIPINDFSTPTGAFDFGQNFMSNVTQVEVYKGSAGAHFGADAIGGAINFVTTVDYDNRFSIGGNNNSKTLQGNYTTIFNDWHINVQGGTHESETVSALSGGKETDGTKNKSIGVNIIKWFSDNLKFRSSLFTRNTFTDLDGHSLAIENGFSDNSFYAFQTGLDYTTKDSINSLTLHTHEYDREYESDNYNSKSYTVRTEHQTKNYGLGLDYKYDESLTADDDNVGLFGNFNYNIFSFHARKDNDDDSYKVGFFKEIVPNFNIRGNHSTGYKNPTLYTLKEHSVSNELSLDYNDFTLSLFESDIGDLNTDGIELSYNIDNFTIYGSHLNSKKNDTVQLRRPEWNFGIGHIKVLPNDFNLTTNYNFKGEHLDVHNSNWSTISMPELHMLDMGITKDYFNYEFGLSINNVLDEDYEAPHGFNQNGRSLNFVFKRKF